MKVHLSFDANKTMNVLGYVPVVGTMSASVRLMAGQAEMIYGIAMSVFNAVETLHHGVGAARGLFPKLTQVTKEESEEYIKETAKQYVQLQGSVEHVKNGFLNVVRATIEAIPVVSYMVLYPYDRIKAEVISLNEDQKRGATEDWSPKKSDFSTEKVWKSGSTAMAFA